MRKLLAVGVVISGSAAAWLRLESVLPTRFAPALRVSVESSSIGLPPSAPETAQQVQTAGLNSLLGVVAVLTILGAAVALLSCFALALARATERRAELATRAALGATPRLLFRELLREPARAGLWAMSVGAPTALAIAFATRQLWPGPGAFDARDVWTALLLAMIPAALTPLAAAGVAYLAVAKGRLAGILGTGGRATASPGEVAFRNFLPTIQIAASLALMVAAASLMVNAMPITSSKHPRDLEDVSIARVGRLAHDPDALHKLAAVLNEQNAEAAAISFGTIGAWVGPGESDRVTAECDNCVYGSMSVPFNVPQMIRHAVGPKYFDTAGIRLVTGRDFTLADDASAEPVIIVNESFAARNFRDGRVLGRKIEIGAMDKKRIFRIIGVVEDVNTRTIGNPDVGGTIYFSALQQAPDRIEIVARGTGADVVAIAQRAGIAAESPVSAISLLKRHLAPVQFLGFAMLLIAAAGMIVTLHGVHAMLRASVSRRVREIGIRMAIGADPRAIVRLIFGHAAAIAAGGALIGSFLAFAAARGVQVLIPAAALASWTIAAAILLLGATAMVGALSPARRAARVDPIVCLRAE